MAVSATALVGWVMVMWARDLGLASLSFALSANVAVMAWTVMVFRALRPSLEGPWFRPAGWERGGRFWRRVGVHLYAGVLRAVGWTRVRRVGVDVSVASLRSFDAESRSAEAAHLVGLAGVGMLGVYAAVREGPEGAVYLLGAAVPLHLYPALLQRYLRPRVQRALAWRERRSQTRT